MYKKRIKKGSWIDMQRREQRLRDAEIWMTGGWDDVLSKDESKANHNEGMLRNKGGISRKEMLELLMLTGKEKERCQ
jgi:hypothetical protein